MKNGKCPTKKQKQLIAAAGLNENEWLIVKNLSDKMILVHRVNQKSETISIA
jgi:hypothetical protein